MQNERIHGMMKKAKKRKDRRDRNACRHQMAGLDQRYISEATGWTHTVIIGFMRVRNL